MAHRSGKGALVALMAAASIALGAGVSSATPVKVKAAFGNRWVDSSESVAKGTKVVWKNPINLGTEHNLRSYGQNWNFGKTTLESGESTSKRFKRLGTFRYRCTIHSFKQDGKWAGMVGKVKVTK